MTWRPIHTAPKDGTQILVFRYNKRHPTWPDKSNGFMMVTAKYVGREELNPYGCCYVKNCNCHECPEPDEFKTRVLVTPWNHQHLSDVGFTHWKPLPKFPKDTGNHSGI